MQFGLPYEAQRERVAIHRDVRQMRDPGVEEVEEVS